MAQHTYDIIVIGGGVAGLFLAARLKRMGYNLILVEKDALGSGQTLASQGMIHGGQKYALGGGGDHSAAIAAMPARWDACLGGWGEVNIGRTRILSENQVMFPAGGPLSRFSVMAAAHAVRGRVSRLARFHYPEALTRGPVYEMHEKVLDTKSLVAELAAQLDGRIVKGDVAELLPDGQIAVSGLVMNAQAVIFTAGAGNEEALSLLRVREKKTQRRPLRQVMVKGMEHPLYGHGVWSQPKPRVTITSHPHGDGYVWYLGGNVAERGAKMSEDETLAFARKEMQEIFPRVDWNARDWATVAVDRAEAYEAAGNLPPGPQVQQRGRVMIAWPTKLTFAPLLADKVCERLTFNNIVATPQTAVPPLPVPEIAQYPWEAASWRSV